MTTKTTKRFAAALALALAVAPLTSADAASATPLRIAGLAPKGTNPSTPRVNWDVCDMPGSLAAVSTGAPVSDTNPQWKDARSFNWFTQQLPSVTLYQPWALVACTESGSFLVPSRTTPFNYSVTVTDVSHQVVYVAQVYTAGGHPGVAWEHAAWRELSYGQSTTLAATTTWDNIFSTPYLLVRPTALPVKYHQDWLGNTDWVYETPVFYIATPHPSGDCTGLDPGTAVGIASAPEGGYWVNSSSGEVSPCGASNFNNTGDASGGFPYVGKALSSEDGSFIASDPVGNGYWTVSSDGYVNAYGAARWYGQSTNQTLVSAAAAMPDGEGYWFVTTGGRVFHYGDAPYFGSAHVADAAIQTKADTVGEYTLTPASVVGIAPTEGAHGYVLVARDGTVYGFGRHDGETCGKVALASGAFVVGVAADYRTGGYWVAETDGHVAACHAPVFPYKDVVGTVMGIGALGNGLGYRLVTAGGSVYDYGAATWRGNA